MPDAWAIPKTNTRLKDALEFVSFADFGGVFDNNVNRRGTVGVNSLSGRVNGSAFALGVGFGLRARLTQYLNARVDVGFPMLKASPDVEDARLHFGLESRLF